DVEWKKTILPNGSDAAYLGLPFLQNGWFAFRNRSLWKRWMSLLKRGRNVLFDQSDLGPWLAQPAALLPYLQIAVEKRRSLIAATTADIEWNGDPIE
ncbi:MAG: hypothetical protein AAF633_27495, partial [Chloroflexota bacterium]